MSTCGVDRETLRCAVEGDTSALSTLLAEHGPRIERTLRIDKAWRAQLDSADVMQVTYVEAFRHIRDFDPTRAERFEAWLRQMAENNLRDAIRGLTRQKRSGPGGARAVPPADAMAALMLAITTSTPSRTARQSERAASLETALGRLPPDYALAVRRLDLEGRSVGEVAAELGRSAGAVHMLRARAHDRLRELLGPASAFRTSS